MSSMMDKSPSPLVSKWLMVLIISICLLPFSAGADPYIIDSEKSAILKDPRIFNAQFYTGYYADLTGLTPEQAFNHWFFVGHTEGRRASPQFSSLEYLRQYPGLTLYGRRDFYYAIRTYVTWGHNWGHNGNMPRPASLPHFKIGMLYNLWHCPMRHGTGNVIYNSQSILDSKGTWGPLYTYHWWDRPTLDYYCLSNDDHVLIQHALMLRDAGVDFVIVDSTNSPYTKNADWNLAINNPIIAPLNPPQEAIIYPFDRMIEIWSWISGAPKIVPWVPIQDPNKQRPSGCPSPDMSVYFDWKLRQYPQTNFIYDGKPLVLANSAKIGDPNLARCLGEYHSDDAAIVGFEKVYTVRKMWGMILEIDEPNSNPAEWSFLAPCQRNFKYTNGAIDCDQRVSMSNGVPEQISVTTAYQYPNLGLLPRTCEILR